MEGRIRALFVTPERKARPVALCSVKVIPAGFEGDYHSRFATQRQILLMPGSVLNELEIEPGAVKENAVIDGLGVMSLAAGQQLRIGSAILEVTVPCEPCIQMDRVRYGLQEALQNRRGMFVKVVASGSIGVGDVVEVLSHA